MYCSLNLRSPTTLSVISAAVPSPPAHISLAARGNVTPSKTVDRTLFAKANLKVTIDKSSTKNYKSSTKTSSQYLYKDMLVMPLVPIINDIFIKEGSPCGRMFKFGYLLLARVDITVIVKGVHTVCSPCVPS
jgi:hypothetical protein